MNAQELLFKTYVIDVVEDMAAQGLAVEAVGVAKTFAQMHKAEFMKASRAQTFVEFVNRNHEWLLRFS